MTVHFNSSLFPMVNDINYEPYTCNQSMLLNDFYFNILDFVAGVANNNLNFDEFIINCKTISQESSLDVNRNTSNVEDLFMDNDANEFVIERIFEIN